MSAAARSQFPLCTELQTLIQQDDVASQNNINLILAASQKCDDLLTDPSKTAQFCFWAQEPAGRAGRTMLGPMGATS
ncbi:MAG TPA: hypothetical protein VF664_02050 [Cystobacter sp.]